jgi:uncharacterized membrane protein
MESVFERNATSVAFVYLLYLVAILIPLTAVVGAFIAYQNRTTERDWLSSHCDYQIRSFWIGLVYALGLALIVVSESTRSLASIAFVLAVPFLIWWVVRCIKGRYWARPESRCPILRPGSGKGGPGGQPVRVSAATAGGHGKARIGFPSSTCNRERGRCGRAYARLW